MISRSEDEAGGTSFHQAANRRSGVKVVATISSTAMACSWLSVDA